MAFAGPEAGGASLGIMRQLFFLESGGKKHPASLLGTAVEPFNTVFSRRCCLRSSPPLPDPDKGEKDVINFLTPSPF